MEPHRVNNEPGDLILYNNYEVNWVGISIDLYISVAKNERSDHASVRTLRLAVYPFHSHSLRIEHGEMNPSDGSVTIIQRARDL